MKQGIQTFFDEAGDAMCYAIDIVELARRIKGQSEDDANIVADLERGIAAGHIHYSWDNPDDSDNFFVTDPSAFLSSLTGQKWTVRKEDAAYFPRPGELIVQRWERQVTGQTIGHFRLPDWDSLIDSKTVKLGKIVSLRVFAPAA